MNPIRHAKQIEVGMHEGRIGFTVEYVDGERAHFLFATEIATRLAEQLLKVAADLEYLKRQMTKSPADRVAIKDEGRIELTPPAPSAGEDIGISGTN